MRQTERSRLEFLVLADRAEVVGGKLYMMGGCWDRLFLPEFPVAHPVGVATKVLLPSEDREDHTIELTISGPGEPTVSPRGIRFVRQTASPGKPHAPVIVGIGAVIFMTEPGTYTLTAAVDGGEPTEAKFDAETADIA